jgi:hypothetical protein
MYSDQLLVTRADQEHFSSPPRQAASGGMAMVSTFFFPNNASHNHLINNTLVLVSFMCSYFKKIVALSESKNKRLT